MPRQGKREYVSFKSVRLPLYPHGKGWRFAYPDDSVKGGWRYGYRSTKKEAKEAAHSKAVEIAGGLLDLSTLSQEQARLARAFLDMNPTWETISMIQKYNRKTVPLNKAIIDFMDYKIQETGKSTIHLKAVNQELIALQNHFGSETELQNIKAPEIDEWLSSLKLSPKRTNAYRASAVALWGWLAKQDLIEVIGTHTEASKTTSRKVPQSVVEVFTPDEMKALLTNAPPEILPWLVICGFSGVRSGEIAGLDKPPLTWDYVRYESDIIEVPANVSKNKKRKLIPITPTLKAWLKYLGNPKSGTIISKSKINQAPKELSQYIDKWKDNALRHSYGSYRVAILKDLAAVSLEMDNSPSIIKKHYLEAQEEKVARDYFDLTPSDLFRTKSVTP